MFFVWTVGEAGKKTYGIANVEMAYYVGKDKFAKNISIRETFLGDNLFCFGCLLRWTLKSHQAIGDSRLNGNRCRTVVFFGRRGIPSMCLEHTINAGLAAQLDAVLSLKDVNAIVLLTQTSFSFNAHDSIFSLDVFMDLGDEKFSSVWRLSTYCKIINLTAD